MARFGCKCGNTLSTTSSPNDVELHVYTDKEWDEIINLGNILSSNIPFPRYEVWRCNVCERIYVFKENSNDVYKVYKLEE